MSSTAAFVARQPKPFWHRLNAFFLFPFQLVPLMYGVALALASLLHEIIFFMPEQMSLWVVELGILLAASRYGFKIIALGSRGVVHARDFPRELDERWASLPWKLFAVLVVQTVLTGWVIYLNPALGRVAQFFISFLFPATVMVLVQSCSIREALSPSAVWATVRTIGWPYAVLCFFLFLLSSGAPVAISLLLPILGGWLAVPLFNFVLIYFGWVMASLLGYVMYQHHAAFGMDLLDERDVDRAPDRRTPEQIAAQQVDADVAQLVTGGNVEGAIRLAYEAQRLRPDDLAAQRRYHQILLLADNATPLIDHAKCHIALLFRCQLPSEALKVYRASSAKGGAFVIEDAPVALALARAEWSNGEARAALALLSGFDKRFRGHACIPDAYELAVRVLVQGLNQADLAQTVLRLLEARYPSSEQTKEARWLLRDQAVVHP